MSAIVKSHRGARSAGAPRGQRLYWNFERWSSKSLASFSWILFSWSSVSMPKSLSTWSLQLLEPHPFPLDVQDGVGKVHAVHDVPIGRGSLRRLVMVADGGDQLLGEVPLLGNERAHLGVIETDGEVLQHLGRDPLFLAHAS